MSVMRNTLVYHIYECHEKYLRLPSFVGKDKRLLFSDIKEKVWKVLSSLQEKLFSEDSKEVLIKVVRQAIPTYVMSCFKLSVTFCNQLESLLS